MRGDKHQLTECGVLFRNATVIDGTGAPGYSADVAVQEDQIIAIGSLAQTRAELEIDARGFVLAPGFIDTHAHDDAALINNPAMEMKVSQGVTSVVIGNCGFSLAPFTPSGSIPPIIGLFGDAANFRFPAMQDYLSELQRRPAATNVATLVGHSTLRMDAVSDLDRPATAEEQTVMQGKLDDAMSAGAIGFSTGLFYGPSIAATQEEAAQLARTAAQRGGIYATHIRDEGDAITESLQEAFSIAREGQLPIVISHHKVAGRANFGRSRETLALIEAFSRQHSTAFDVYPYTAASSQLHPDYVRFASRIIVTDSQPYPALVGKDVAEIAQQWGCSQAEAVERLQPGGATYFIMDEADVRRMLSHSMAMIGSDGVPGGEHPHPRLWGTFPRVIGHYARDLGLFPVSEAIRRMTSLPAATFGFERRGVIRPGWFADLVLFDPKNIRDRADYDQPKRPAEGIHCVMVNGQMVWREQEAAGNFPGRVLKRGGNAGSGAGCASR